MIESSLIDSSYTQPWADQIILKMDVPPGWICDLAVKTYYGDLLKTIGGYVFHDPIEPAPEHLDRFHVACLWLRYERRELSWATFLKCTGEYLDRTDSDWDCETPYHYLNVHEDAYFSDESQKGTQRDYFADQDLKPWITIARERFAPFHKLRKSDKHLLSGG